MITKPNTETEEEGYECGVCNTSNNEDFVDVMSKDGLLDSACPACIKKEIFSLICADHYVFAASEGQKCWYCEKYGKDYVKNPIFGVFLA